MTLFGKKGDYVQMKNETTDILKLIKAGEGQDIEFKVAFSPEIGKTICAFANTNSGTLLVGVADDGTIKGVGTSLEEKIASVAHSCKPSIYPEIRKVPHDGRLVLVVQVPHSDAVLHSCGNIAYRRVGSTDRPIAPDEIINIAKYSQSTKFDSLAMDAGIEEIDTGATASFVTRANKAGRLDVDPTLPVPQLLEKLRFLKDGRITHAGVLLFGREPQRHVLQSEVRCARFKGNEPVTFIDMKVITGTVIDQIDKVEQFVQNHVSLGAEIKGFQRIEKWEYPMAAIREAVTNAICHRDYTSTANVQLSIFDERIDIWNPGGLPPDLSLESLRKPHRSIPRNEFIAHAMYLVKYIERFGTGTQRMIKDAAEHGLTEIEFKQEQGGFLVVLKKAEAFLSVLNVRQRRAWDYLKSKASMGRKAYTELCGCSIRTAVRDLEDMVSKHLLQKLGRGKSITYKKLL